jgi:hypothetical protein
MAGARFVDTLNVSALQNAVGANNFNPAALRITMPAALAADLGAFNKSLAVIAERIGHPACFSGLDCSFGIERNMTIDNIRGEALVRGAGDEGPQGFAGGQLFLNSLGQGQSVSATLPSSVMNDMVQLQEAVARIADRIGCPACCSGFDILFRMERDFIVDADLNVRGAF